MYLYSYLYLSPDGNLGFFQYLLVYHLFISDQSPHSKYILGFCYRIHINHLCFLQFVQFVVGGILIPNQRQGKLIFFFF